MIFNPKRQVADTTPRPAAPHVPSGHMPAPLVKNEENRTHPQTLTGPNHGTPEPKTATPAEHGYANSGHGTPQSAASAPHGSGGFNYVLTMGDAKLVASLEGVAEPWLAKARAEVANGPGDWLVTPSFARILIDARKTLDEVVQLHHGATRVLVSRPGDVPRIYEVRGPLRPHTPEVFAADMLAADLQYMLIVSEAADVAQANGKLREYAWLKDHYLTWCTLLDGHFAPLRDELLQVTVRFMTACEKWEAGFAPEKEAKNVAAIRVLLERMTVLHEHLWTYRPAYLPTQYFSKRTWRAN